MDLACALLRFAGHMGLDRYLFSHIAGNSGLGRVNFLEAGISKLRHVRGTAWITAGLLADMVGLRSVHLVSQVLDHLRSDLSVSVLEYLDTVPVADCRSEMVDFPELVVRVEWEDWQDSQRKLLSLGTPALGNFSGLNKWSLYFACTKVLNFRSLMDLRETKWTEVVGADSLPKGSWQSLYKRPIEKRVGDLQWRIVHGILATNRHVARLDPLAGDGCPFCGASETLFHVFVQCSHLRQILALVRKWGLAILGSIDQSLFLFGQKYSVSRRDKVILLNFLYGEAKLAIWCSRKNRIRGCGGTDPVLMVRGLVSGRLLLEYAYYSLTVNVDMFFAVWGVGGFICEPDDQGGFVMTL
ncbi:hypothetical protein MHYP_G00234320 [Metynnis hypsauchen]